MISQLFTQLVKGVPLVSEILLFKENDMEYSLVGFHENSLFVTKLNSPAVTSGTPKPPTQCAYQEFFIGHQIIIVYHWTDKLYVLDRKGFLHQVSSNASDDDTGDFFEDSPTKDCGGHIKELRQINTGEMLAACFLPPRAMLILSYICNQTRLALSLYNLDTNIIENSITINNKMLCKPDGVSILFVDAIEKEFVTRWCPHFNPSNPCKGYVFVLNSIESVCLIQLGKEAWNIGFFFSWPSRCIFSSFKDMILKETGEVKTKSCLLLAFEDGAVIKLSSFGGEIFHMSLEKVRCAAHAGQFIICSDYANSQVADLNNVKADLCIYPLKGVISFCAYNNNELLALTYNGGLYLLTLNVKNVDRNVFIPKITAIQDTLNNVGYLNKLNSRITNYDNSIKALIAAINGKAICFQIHFQIVKKIKFHHVFRMFSEVLKTGGLAPIIIKRNDWHVVMIFTSKRGRKIIHVKRLESDFSYSKPLDLTFEIDLDIEDNTDFVISVKLISFANDGKCCPSLFVGKVHLNILSFLEPEYSKSMYKNGTAFNHQLAVMKYQTDGMFFDYDINKNVHVMADPNFHVEIPLKYLEASMFARKIMEASQALWPSKLWNSVTDSTNFTAILAGRCVSINVKQQSICLSTYNVSGLIQIKFAAYNILSPASHFEYSEKQLIEVENLLKNLEVIEFTKQDLTLSGLLNTFKRKVELINDPLIGSITKAI